MNEQKMPLDWVNANFLFWTHAVALFGTAAYLWLHGPTWAAFGIMMFMLVACGFGVTGGYHRLFSHRAFEANAVVRALLLFFGAAQWENSALKWSIDHRRHHSKVDTDEDPYNIKRGFWWAHVGWVLFRDEKSRASDAPEKHRDLTADPLVMLQHRFFIPIATVGSFLLPLALGAAFGDPWGGFLLGGFVRLVVLHHSTFCVNSVAHFIGDQPYSDRDSSRDSFVTALLSMGEGYHNYHHRFPADYRNGVRWWQYDPTKWGIRLLGWLGMARGLKRVPQARILKARLAMDARRATRSLAPSAAEALQSAHAALETLVDRWDALKVELAEVRRRKDRESREALAELRRELEDVRTQLRTEVRRWQQMIRQPELAHG